MITPALCATSSASAICLVIGNAAQIEPCSPALDHVLERRPRRLHHERALVQGVRGFAGCGAASFTP
jgi:hypothetical protein